MKTGQEVSCKAVQHVLQFLDEQGLPSADVLKKLPYSESHIHNPNLRISWDAFVDFMKGVERLCGTERLEECGATSASAGAYRVLRQITGYIASPKTLYWIMNTFAMPHLFHNIHPSFEETEDGRLKLTAELEEGYRLCPQIFRTSVGGIRAGTSLLGLPIAHVTYEIEGRKATYWVTPPPSMSFLSRLIHAAKAIFTPVNMMKEMAQQERRIRESQQQAFEAEVKLRLSTQMASIQKMSALGEMAAGVAHEINNPLTVVGLAVSSLNEKIKNGVTTPETLIKDLNRIQNSSQRIAKIVGGLRLFSRDAGNDPMKACPAKDILQETLQFCQQRFMASSIRLEVENAHSPVQFLCRSTQISQVLLNLLNNAHDAALSAPDPWVRVAIHEENDRAEISVTDSGPGIPPQLREKIFQPFFTTKEIGKGTGLGLSVAKGVIESQGGLLELDESSPHTRFVIRFPNAKPQTEGAA